MVTLRRWFAVALVALVSFQAGFPRIGGAAAAAQADKPTPYKEAYDQARQQLQRREYFEALKGFQRANQLAGGRSAECALGMAQTMLGMKTYQNAVETAQTAIELSPGQPLLQARAHNVRGLAFQALADHDAAKLRDAEAEFRSALEGDPDSRIADLHYNLAVVLIKQRRDEDGIAELRKELAQRANGTTAEEARALMANPRRARETYAPDFSFVSAGGDRISLESLRGKVVLLDFWGTWCLPCLRALPSLRKLQKDHANDAFVLVGISSDTDGRAWAAFTAKNGMVWPQYWDENQKIAMTFGVHAFPTYVLLDGEGIERLRVSGAGYHESKTMGAAIEQQLKLAAPRRP